MVKFKYYYEIEDFGLKVKYVDSHDEKQEVIVPRDLYNMFCEDFERDKEYVTCKSVKSYIAFRFMINS